MLDTAEVVVTWVVWTAQAAFAAAPDTHLGLGLRRREPVQLQPATAAAHRHAALRQGEPVVPVAVRTAAAAGGRHDALDVEAEAASKLEIAGVVARDLMAGVWGGLMGVAGVWDRPVSVRWGMSVTAKQHLLC
jgi:hypothetical protein